MTEEPRFRTDLYRGTASDYDRFRPPYPDQLLDDHPVWRTAWPGIRGWWKSKGVAVALVTPAPLSRSENDAVTRTTRRFTGPPDEECCPDDGGPAAFRPPCQDVTVALQR